jgi:DNA mismatch repair protein MutL
VQAAVKRALAQYSITPTLDFEKEKGFEQMINTPSSSSSSETRPSRFKQDQLKGESKAWRKLYEETLQQEEERSEKEGSPDTSSPSQSEIVQKSGATEERTTVETEPYQVHQRYILTHIKSGLMLIHQQAAHERILYEHYKKALKQQKVVSQQQLFPQKVEFSPADYELVEAILPEIKTLGFDIEPFGQHSFVIHSMPSDIIVDKEQKVFEELIEQYKNNVYSLKLEKREGLALTMARFSSIKPGRVLSAEEMKELIDKLFGCERPYLSPSGKPTLISLTLADLEEQFEQQE